MNKQFIVLLCCFFISGIATAETAQQVLQQILQERKSQPPRQLLPDSVLKIIAARKKSHKRLNRYNFRNTQGYTLQSGDKLRDERNKKDFYDRQFLQRQYEKKFNDNQFLQRQYEDRRRQDEYNRRR